MKRHISIIVLILFVIALVVGLGYSCNIIIQKDKQIAVLNQEVTDLKNNVTELNNKIENMQDVDVNVTEPVVPSEPKEEEKATTIEAFNQEKLENKEEDANIYSRLSDENSVIGIEVDSKNDSLNISTYAEAAKLFFGYTGANEVHTVAGFNCEIVDARIMATGNTPEGIKVVLLMEDGTVKYITIGSILDKSYTVNTVANAQGIVRLTEVVVEKEMETRMDVAGVKLDGTSVMLEW
ncbi:MAG: hypothetical protein J6A15_02235 [Clostridia bacterium]|nr:hypothetical protein [Clostridia bacterium]